MFRVRTTSVRAAVSQVMERLENRQLLAVTLDPLTQPKFVNPLPLPAAAQPTQPGGSDYKIGVTQFQQDLGLVDPVTGKPMLTTVWGYGGSYPGPTIVAQKGVPVNVTWTNDLLSRKNKPLPHLLPIDESIMSGYTGTNNTFAKNGVPIVVHLHGGHTEAASDGTPMQWFTPNWKLTGEDFAKKTLRYANDQDAATLWYHDHALGVTRLNVYAGLAGFYLLRDSIDTGVADNPATPVNENPLGLPTGNYEVGLAVQDRMFTAEGQLYYPTDPTPGLPANSILPEMFGDTILVNGKAWPFMNVEPRKYRLHLLNGSDSRFFNFYLSSGQSFIQIGGDQGLLPKAVAMTQLTLGPGERADVILDFAGLNGQTVIMKNNGKTPYPAGTPSDPQTTGQIMAFKVGNVVTTPEAPLATTLVAVTPLAANVADRKVALFEAEDEFDRILPLLGTPDLGYRAFMDAPSEVLNVGDTQVWEIYNTTADAHPIHLHLVKFQVLSRQSFTATVDEETGVMSNIALQGSPQAAPANEAGWKDTVVIRPGQMARIIANFDMAGEYVWHCHILSHEEHDMMRPLIVQALPAAQPVSAMLFSSTSIGETGAATLAVDAKAKEELLA
jgi:spore coat protein A, manganese oxidase